MLYGFQHPKPEVAIAAAMVYWCYRCRDHRSQVNGLEAWKRLTNCIQNAARPSEDLDAYLEQLCRLLYVENLRPDVWRAIVSPADRVTMVRVHRGSDGAIQEIQELEADAAIAFETWHDLLNYHRPDGLTEDDILRTAEQYPHIIAAVVRLRRDQDLALGRSDRDETEATIDVGIL